MSHVLAELVVDVFDVAVLDRFAAVDEAQADIVRKSPFLYGLPDEFRAVIVKRVRSCPVSLLGFYFPLVTPSLFPLSSPTPSLACPCLPVCLLIMLLHMAGPASH